MLTAFSGSPRNIFSDESSKNCRHSKHFFGGCAGGKNYKFNSLKLPIHVYIHTHCLVGQRERKREEGSKGGKEGGREGGGQGGTVGKKGRERKREGERERKRGSREATCVSDKVGRELTSDLTTTLWLPFSSFFSVSSSPPSAILSSPATVTSPSCSAVPAFSFFEVGSLS